MNETPPRSINMLCGGVILEGKFPVCYDNCAVGEVTVCQRGLYYFISCRCTLPGKAHYRLYADCEAHMEELGVLAPDRNEYSLQIHIPCKKLCSDQPVFLVFLSKLQCEEQLILDAKAAVSCISRLENAYLQRAGDNYFLKFKKAHAGSSPD